MSIVGTQARVDEGMVQALAGYLAFGLDPGSFGMALLRGDRSEAYATAHPLLVPEPDDPTGLVAEDVVATMFEVVEAAVPTFARGDYVDEWMKHAGLDQAPISQKTMLKMSIESPLLYNYVSKHYPQVMAE